MNTIRTITVLVFTSVFLPFFSYAQESPDLTYIEDAVVSIGALVEQLIPIAIAIGLLFFIWGLVQFIAASGNEDAKETGKRRMVWGILALFVIVSVWGLVDLLADIAGIETGGTIETPSIPI
jgi:hypothetical protein